MAGLHARARAATVGRWRRTAVLGAAALVTGFVPSLLTGSADATVPVNGASFTTTNVNASTGNGSCLNGNPSSAADPVNCNIYTSKRDVWFNGGPASAQLSDGTYAFAVLVPGGQSDPTDAAALNLSDTTLAPYTATAATNTDTSARPSGDSASARTFTMSGGKISGYAGSHAFQNGKIQLFPYDDTTNPGGVYILAVCSLTTVDAATTVDPSACKFDAFKVRKSSTVCTSDCGGTTANGDVLGVAKTAIAKFDRNYTWHIAKSVTNAATQSGATGATATFNYAVTVNHDAAVDSNYVVKGNITVTNPNPVSVQGTVSDDLVTADTNVTCVVTGGGSTTFAPGNNVFPYTCTYVGAPSSLIGTNNGSLTWERTTWTDNSTNPPTPFVLNAGSDEAYANYSFSTGTVSGQCVTVGDGFDGGTSTDLTAGTPICATPGSTAAATYPPITYSRGVTYPLDACTTKGNTATFSTDDTIPATGSASASVTACGRSGALTIGFWQNKNGQGILTNANQSALQAYLVKMHPFSTAPTSGLATYSYNIIKAASCTSTSKTCNSMLRAQMLATALDTYFSDPLLGGNKIGQYSGLGSAQPAIGNLTLDLTKVCAMIDGSGGAATCPSQFEDASPAFGAAKALTVQQMLDYQNTSDPLVDSGAVWYGNTKPLQVLAKDAFDAINNQVVTGP
jgi:hypothetical protein